MSDLPKPDLSQRAMLVSLHISYWRARKTDRRVNRHVAEHYGTAEKVGNYRKSLLPQECPSHAAIAKIAIDAAEEHRRLTLPWQEGGRNGRILCAAGFDAYAATMRGWRNTFETAQRTFLCDYPDAREEARLHLNGLFRDAEYPDVQRMERLFRFKVSVFPLPDVADFRVDLGETDVEAIRRQVRDDIADGVEAAARDAWERLRAVLQHMAERLTVPNAVYRDTLFENVRDLCAILPTLNLFNDPRLARLTESVQQEVLAQFSPQQCRDDMVARAAAAAKVNAIMASMEGFGK